MILDGRRLSEGERLKLLADEEVGSIADEPWFRAEQKRAALDTQRNAARSVASVLAEFRARGYQGFTAVMADGVVVIEGVSWSCEDGESEIPVYLRAAGGL